MAHFHEVMLPDGTVLNTGPPVTSDLGDELASEDESAAGAAPGELRAPKRKQAPPKALDVPGMEAAEATQAAKAMHAANPDQLPEYAKLIYRRMYESALRWCQGDERKAAAAGWRAIREKYGIDAPPPPQRTARASAGKALAAGTPAGRRGAAYLVRVNEERDADMKYARTEQVPVPGWPGVLVTVGHGPPNHRNILSVLVPDRYTDGTGHGMAGAAKFVRNHWDVIWSAGKGLVGALLTAQKRRGPDGVTGGRAADPNRKQERRLVFKRFIARTPDGRAKYVADPRKATERIAFAENYVPWEVDLQGDYATEAEVERMAHDFLERHGKGGEMHARWTMADGEPAGVVVESFVARRGDPDFTPGAWVTGIKFHPAVWKRIEAGELVGTSIGGRWARRPIFRAEAQELAEEVAA